MIVTVKDESKKTDVDATGCEMMPQEGSQKYNFIGQAGGIPHLKGELKLTGIVFLDPNQGIEVL